MEVRALDGRIQFFKLGFSTDTDIEQNNGGGLHEGRFHRTGDHGETHGEKFAEGRTRWAAGGVRRQFRSGARLLLGGGRRDLQPRSPAAEQLIF